MAVQKEIGSVESSKIITNKISQICGALFKKVIKLSRTLISFKRIQGKLNVYEKKINKISTDFLGTNKS